ncbi:MAG: nucleotidyltransferase family protein, partial [Mariprofundaceae bacterium]|nr:nucleotidyltransferase family protein [Mariprofundaceae bacterium]
PAIVRVIQRMVAAGIRHIAINVHHHAHQIMMALGRGERFGVRLYYSPEAQLLDSGGGLRQAILQLPNPTSVLVHNADICSNIDLRALQQGDAVTLAMVANPPHHAQGDFHLHDGRINASHGRRYTFSGVSHWPASLLLERPAATAFSLLDIIHPCMAAHQCAGLFHDGYWFDIGRPADLFRASHFITQVAYD